MVFNVRIMNSCSGFRELFKTDRLHHAGIDTGSAVDAYLLIAFRSVFIVQLKRFGRALCYAATASYAKIKINCYGHSVILLDSKVVYNNRCLFFVFM